MRTKRTASALYKSYLALARRYGIITGQIDINIVAMVHITDYDHQIISVNRSINTVDRAADGHDTYQASRNSRPPTGQSHFYTLKNFLAEHLLCS